MRKEFINCFGQATNCEAAFLREAYHRLTGDCSAADSKKQAEVDDIINQILDEQDTDLIWDLRKGHSGRPEQFSVFLEQCQKYITSSVDTAVDERRHDAVQGEDVITHLATALSVRDLHDKVKQNSVRKELQYLAFSGYVFNSVPNAHVPKQLKDILAN